MGLCLEFTKGVLRFGEGIKYHQSMPLAENGEEGEDGTSLGLFVGGHSYLWIIPPVHFVANRYNGG